MSRKLGLAPLIGLVVVLTFTLTGCDFRIGASPEASETASTATVVDMSDEAAVSALCGTPDGDGSADAALAAFNELVASEDSGPRNDAFEAWGVNPQDEEAVAAAKTTLEARAAVVCEDVAAGAESTGVMDEDGNVTALPLYEGDGTTVVMDTTNLVSVPPLLDFGQRYQANTLTWQGLVDRVGDQQWYIDDVNARAAQTGFTWDDVLRFASVNRVETDENGNEKVAGVNALAIQIYNLTSEEMTDDQARAEVAKYITPAIEETIGITVADMPIQRIGGGFINTRNVGTKSAPVMGNYFSTEKMVRVSLMPIKFDEAGQPVSLDGSKGAGVFIDCGNLHWVPPMSWPCVDNTCTPPPCPVEVCLTPKDWSQSPNNGWTPRGVGPLTDGRESARQQESGETRGNVTDNQVPAGTESGETTSDLPAGTVTSPGANQGGDNRSDDAQDDTVITDDDGGTDGATCNATDPDTGAAVDCTP